MPDAAAQGGCSQLAVSSWGAGRLGVGLAPPAPVAQDGRRLGCRAELLSAGGVW